jgi:hypothetical protein
VALLSDRANRARPVVPHCLSWTLEITYIRDHNHHHHFIISSSMLQLHHSCALRERGAHVRAVIVAASRELVTEGYGAAAGREEGGRQAPRVAIRHSVNHARIQLRMR